MLHTGLVSLRKVVQSLRARNRRSHTDLKRPKISATRSKVRCFDATDEVTQGDGLDLILFENLDLVRHRSGYTPISDEEVGVICAKRYRAQISSE